MFSIKAYILELRCRPVLSVRFLAYNGGYEITRGDLVYTIPLMSTGPLSPDAHL